MGALTMEIERLNKTIENNNKELEKNQKEVERLQKKLEQQREEKQQQREYERDLKKAVENDCLQCMNRCFEREGYKKALITLQLTETRTDILQHIPDSEIERNYLNNNYEKILNKVKKIYENDQKAKNEMLTQQLREELEKSGNIEIAKKFGYDEDKIYTIKGINKLTNKIQEYIKEQEQKKEEEKRSIFLGLCRFIGLVIKWFCILLFGGIYFIFKFFVELSKGY